MKNKLFNQKGITLLALVVTIVVLLIVAGITLNLVIGENGIVNRADAARTKYREAADDEEYQLDEAASLIDRYDDGDSEPGNHGGNGEDEEPNWDGEGEDAGEDTAPATLGSIYSEELIGKKITYSANGQDNWIIFGEDPEQDGNILITTYAPIRNGIVLYQTAEGWLKYLSYDDSTYGINYACSGYGNTITQSGSDTVLESRSMKIEDINKVIGLTQKTINVDGDNYTIQSFSQLTFGTELNIEDNKVDFYYPDLETEGYWKKATQAGEERSFLLNGYSAFENYHMAGGDYKYTQDYPDLFLDASGIYDLANIRFILGQDGTYEYALGTECVGIETRWIGTGEYNEDDEEIEQEITVASFSYGCVGDKQITTHGLAGTESNSDETYDADGYFEEPIRPVVSVPSSMLVQVRNGAYEFVED